MRAGETREGWAGTQWVVVSVWTLIGWAMVTAHSVDGDWIDSGSWVYHSPWLDGGDWVNGDLGR